MAKKNKTKKKINKYKLVIFNEESLDEVFTTKLSKVNVFTYIGLFTILILGLSAILFIFTPLNNLLPRYQDLLLRSRIEENRVKLDSLQDEIIIRDLYFKNIKYILEGKDIESFQDIIDSSLYNPSDAMFTKSKHDSILQELIRQEEDMYLSIVNEENNDGSLNNINFYKPVNGLISNKFNALEGHYGIDLVADEGEPIYATLSGTVILATWSVKTGYVIQIQHDNNLISIYKHNSELLKKEGEHVNAGETIAIIGNSGELSTGTHLHFELWHNGTPLDPELYLVL